jgi:hypothetical protein
MLEVNHNSKSNIPSSILKDDLSDSFKGASVRRAREGRLDKLELLLHPFMAELQLEAGDECLDREPCEPPEFLVRPIPIPWFSSVLQLQVMTSHSSFCLLDGSSDDIGLA